MFDYHELKTIQKINVVCRNEPFRFLCDLWRQYWNAFINPEIRADSVAEECAHVFFCRCLG